MRLLIGGLFLLALIVACTGPAGGERGAHSTGVAEVSAEADSFGHGVAFPGDWQPTRVLRGPGFSLSVPEGATSREYGGSIWVEGLPHCRWSCVLEIKVFPDTGRLGLERWVRWAYRLDEPVDTADFDPRSTIIGRVELGQDSAIELDTFCGDCDSGALVTARNGRIATIDWYIDDRNEYDSTVVMNLRQIVASYRWQ